MAEGDAAMTYAAFGMGIGGRALPGCARVDGEPDVVLAPGDPYALFSGAIGRAREAVVDGAPLTVERGAGADHLVTWGASSWWISPDASEVVGAGAERILMDSVLGTVALLRGSEALHAGAVEIDGRAVAVAGPPGAGKTTLLAELVRRGHPLLADDVLVLDGAAAHPAPALMTLGPAAGALGSEVARVGNERWVVLEPVAPGARPVGAVCFLRRGGDGPVVAEPLARSPVPLLPHLLPSGPDRERERFEAAAALAGEALLIDLSGGSAEPPGAFATALEDALAQVVV